MTEPLIGRIIGGRYRIERPIGAGGMGAVYVATQIHLSREVALKTLLDATDPRDVERLRIEATAAAALAHPNIVHVSDFIPGGAGEPPCIVMELLAGRSLARFLRERGPLPLSVALHITRQMLSALGAAHAAGIVHRDVKPANVIVLDGGDPAAPRVKLVDFGIAKLLDDGSRHTTTGTVLGTPHYMAPEQHLALPPTPGVDVWAVGVCLFEMLSGRRPFTGSIDEVFVSVTRKGAPDLPGVPRDVADAVAIALTRDPSVRYADASAMLRALGAEQVNAPVPAPAPTVVPRGPRRVGIFILVTVATAIAATAVALVATRPRGDRSSSPLDGPPDAPSAAASAAPPPTLDEPLPVASDEAPPPSSANAVAVPSPPKTVPCVCSDGWVPFCMEPILACTCQNAGPGQICLLEWPDERCPLSASEVLSKTDRTGQTCRGWTRSTSGLRSWTESAEGKFRCMNGCSSSYVRSHPTMAVPGTPCRGFAGDEPRAGKWMKLVPPR